jgi:hypothetical protein
MRTNGAVTAVAAEYFRNSRRLTTSSLVYQSGVGLHV